MAIEKKELAALLKELKEKYAEEAKETAKSLGITKIWVNKKGEFFTSEMNAQLSGNKDEVVGFDFSEEEEKQAPEPKMVKTSVKVTQEILDKYPEQVKQGMKIGDTIEIEVPEDVTAK